MLVLNTSSISNDSRVLKEVRTLTGEGYRVTLIGLRQPGEATPAIDGAELRLWEMWSRKLGRAAWTWPLKYTEFILRSGWRVFRARPEVVHAHDLDALAAVYPVARLLGARVVYDAHELYAERPLPLRRMWLALDRYLVPRVDHIITANEERADVVQREYGARTRPLVLVNCPAAAPRAMQRSLRSSLPGELRNRLLVVYQGGLTPGRGLEALVAALAHCDPEIVLVLMGHPTAYADQVLTKLVREMGLSQRVVFLPPVAHDEVTAFIRDADIGVVIYENRSRNNWLCAPNKLFEYCAAGLAMVGCAFPPIVRFMQEYPVGHLFDPSSPSSIAQAINQLRRHPQAMEAARLAARDASRRYCWEAESRKLKELYRVMGGHGGGAERTAKGTMSAGDPYATCA
jgi:glycosyltransferase involved in cell wall biosynthesis